MHWRSETFLSANEETAAEIERRRGDVRRTLQRLVGEGDVPGWFLLALAVANDGADAFQPESKRPVEPPHFIYPH
jgi:hypothetical protein